jgi:hypothetical protein
MLVTYDHDNLRKHRTTPDEADEVLANDPLDFTLTSSRTGNTRVMFIGFTYTGRLLEIGVEYRSAYHEHVFHGMRARKIYRLAFQKEMKR